MNPLCPVCVEAAPAEALHCPRCGAALLLRDRYRLERRLGGGGQGQTFAARDSVSGDLVTVKELSLAHVRDWKSVELFERQAKVLRGVRHPGIPRFIDEFRVDRGGVTFFYLVREFIEGESLAEALERGERFNEAMAIALARKVLEILGYLHDLSPPVIHRDLKPSNLLLRNDGRMVLIDFGLVRERSGSQAGSTVAVGTMGYAPLEQLVGEASPATDLYALGATLIALMARAEPASLMQPGDPRIHFRKRVRASRWFEDVLGRLVEPDPRKRYSSAAQVLRALAGPPPKKEQKHKPSRPSRASTRPRRRSRRAWPWKRITLIAGGALLGLSLGVTPLFALLAGLMAGYHETVMEALRECPAARERLGDGIRVSYVGVGGCGKASWGGGSGQASFGYPVTGSKGSGSYRFVAAQRNDEWRLVRGQLKVGGETIDVARCAQAAASAAAQAPASKRREEVPTAPGVKPLTVEAAAKLPLLQVPLGRVLAAAKRRCAVEWYGAYLRGKKIGHQRTACGIERYRGREVFSRSIHALFPRRRFEIRTRTLFATTGRGEILRYESKRIQGKAETDVLVSRSSSGWTTRKTEGEGGTRKARRGVVSAVEETLTNTDLAVLALVQEGKVKPADRFRYAYFDPEKSANQQAAIQILATGVRQPSGASVTKLEILLLHNGQRSILVLDDLARRVWSSVGALSFRRQSEKEAKRLPPPRKSSGCGGGLFLAIPVIVLLSIFGPAVFRRARRWWQDRRSA